VKDDPDARFEAAEPVEQPIPQARPRRKPSNPRAPYHEPLLPEHEEELALSIGQGLALLQRRENEPPEALLDALVAFVDQAAAGKRRLTRDPSDAAFALGCAFGQQICRGLGFGWAHLRRSRPPGIVVLSADFRRLTGPRSVVDAALARGQGALLRDHYAELAAKDASPSTALYARVRPTAR
jgi:hypothetical protein